MRQRTADCVWAEAREAHLRDDVGARLLASAAADLGAEAVQDGSDVDVAENEDTCGPDHRAAPAVAPMSATRALLRTAS